jgi:hypothetical protein
MLKLVAKGPEPRAHEDVARDGITQNQRPSRPLSAVPDSLDEKTPAAKE